jgi:hypothetical protein
MIPWQELFPRPEMRLSRQFLAALLLLVPPAGLLMLSQSAAGATAVHYSKPISGGIVLAGERVVFDSLLEPRFTEDQIRDTAGSTRAGLVRWAATPHGRKMIEYFIQNDCLVTVTEDLNDEGIGKAPQPGLATLMATASPSRPRLYTVSLNPRAIVLPERVKPLPNQPATAGELMAAAWAAEMLHISFYAQGISLPHHSRSDFQTEWSAVAAELGFPGLIHDDRVEDPPQGPRRVIRIGYGRHQ